MSAEDSDVVDTEFTSELKRSKEVTSSDPQSVGPSTRTRHVIHFPEISNREMANELVEVIGVKSESIHHRWIIRVLAYIEESASFEPISTTKELNTYYHCVYQFIADEVALNRFFETVSKMTENV